MEMGCGDLVLNETCYMVIMCGFKEYMKAILDLNCFSWRENGFIIFFLMPVMYPLITFHMNVNKKNWCIPLLCLIFETINK